MGEYISRETLRDLMYTEAFERDTGLQCWDSGLWIRYKLFENCIEAIPAADVVERPRWIPVTERLPECYKWVLGSTDEHEMPIEVFYDGFRWQDCILNVEHVTHWMPLPDPPEEEE